MFTRIRSKLTYANVAATLAVVMGLGGFAIASIPNSNGVFTGCIDANTGGLRVIDESTQTCPDGDQRITWNQQGVQGPTGATGPQGPQGPEGAPGKNGRDGSGATINAFTGDRDRMDLPGRGARASMGLRLTAGTYVFIAKGKIAVRGAVSRGGITALAGCTIDAAREVDKMSFVFHGQDVLYGGNRLAVATPQTISLAGVGELKQNGFAYLRCTRNSDTTRGYVENLRLTAIKIR